MARPRTVDYEARSVAARRLPERREASLGVSPPGTPTAIYARISPRPMNARGTYSVLSIEEQRAICREACARNGWPVRYDLVDRLESAKDMDRPSLQRLFEHVEGGRVGNVVVWKLDRMWRSLRDAVNLWDFFAQHGVGFHSCTENFDNQTPFGRFVFRNVASAAELEREIIRERTVMAAHSRARMGLWVAGVVPYGYRREGAGGLVVEDAEAHNVRLIFGHYMRLQSIESVADAMNAAGSKGRGGRPWTYSMVQRVLANPIYGGRLILAGIEHARPDLAIVEPLAVSESDRIRGAGKERRARRVPPSRRDLAMQHVLREYARVLDASEGEGEIAPFDPLADELARIKEGWA